MSDTNMADVVGAIVGLGFLAFCGISALIWTIVLPVIGMLYLTGYLT